MFIEGNRNDRTQSAALRSSHRNTINKRLKRKQLKEMSKLAEKAENYKSLVDTWKQRCGRLKAFHH